MAHATETPPKAWTAADLVERFGAIPLNRLRFKPSLGAATEEDVTEIHDREKRLCELIDGVLVEKTVGGYESYLAVAITSRLWNHVVERKLGIVLGADGMFRLIPGLVRIPDVSFISRDRLPDGKPPRTAFVEIAPDLAVEVLSPSNTDREMQQKLIDYFQAGVRLVWYVDPARRSVRVYTSPTEFTDFVETQILTGGAVLPEFRLPLKELFAEP